MNWILKPSWAPIQILRPKALMGERSPQVHCPEAKLKPRDLAPDCRWWSSAPPITDPQVSQRCSEDAGDWNSMDESIYQSFEKDASHKAQTQHQSSKNLPIANWRDWRIKHQHFQLHCEGGATLLPSELRLWKSSSVPLLSD